MKKILLVLLGLIVLIGGGIYYLLQPKTLGIKFSQEDFSSIRSKLGVTVEPLDNTKSAGKTLLVSGSHPVDQTFTSAELSAIASNRHKEYSYFPFRNVQIRVNPDGSVEGSASIHFQDAVKYLLTLGVTGEDIAKGAEKFKVPNANLPVYLKASGIIINNQSKITISQAEIARIPVPQNLVNQYAPAVNSLIDSIIQSRRPSYNVEKLEVVDGKVHFKGNAPDKEQAVKN